MIRVGFGESVISPPNPGDHSLAGYIGRRGRARGVHDDIYARISCIEASNGDLVVLVNLDLLAVDEHMYRDIKGIVEKSLGRNARLLVSATHTHSAPLTLFRSVLPTLGAAEFDKDYYGFFLGRVEEALEKAVNDMHPSEVEVWVKRVTGVATDRNDPRREIDDQAISLVFKGGGGVDGIIVNYAVHPTILGPENLYISGDIAGYLMASLKRILGARYVAFINGAAANVSTRFTRLGRGFDEVGRLGEKLAQQIASPDAREAVEIKDVKSIEGSMVLGTRRFGRELLRYRLLELRLRVELLLRARGSGRRLIESRLEAIKAIERLARSIDDRVEVNITVLRLGGELSIVACPLELDSSISIELKRSSPFKYNVISCYTNGYKGYLTTATDQSYESLVQIIHPSEVSRVIGFLKDSLLKISL